jgi:hypothetical protein
MELLDANVETYVVPSIVIDFTMPCAAARLSNAGNAVRDFIFVYFGPNSLQY